MESSTKKNTIYVTTSVIINWSSFFPDWEKNLEQLTKCNLSSKYYIYLDKLLK